MAPELTPRNARSGWSRVLPAACLLAPFAALLAVPTYAGGSPELFGVPFFYWYQLAWVLLTPALMTLAYLAVRRSSGEQS
jgi:hypothetical protein